MSSIDDLLQAYERFVRLPWGGTLAGPQRVWFVVYEPAQERRLRLRIDSFATATKAAGHAWSVIDLTNAFATWMAQHEYRDSYFERPDDIEFALQDFAVSVIEQVQTALSAPGVDSNTVVAISGLASLFGLMRASVLMEAVAPAIRGRLLVFFPGQHEGSNYRLLGARDGWNYLAVPITATEGE